MRTVIYDAEDMEPITVIDVPGHFVRDLESGKVGPELTFAIIPALRISDIRAEEPFRASDFRSLTVRIRFEPIFKGRERLMWLATTMDGETALLMRSAFLPGQQKEVQLERQKAFTRGFFAAISATI